MRNPFQSKNSLPDSERWQIGQEDDRLSFEESLADAKAHGALERPGERRLPLGALAVLLLAIFILLAGRLYYLAVVRHQYYSEIAQGNRLRIEYLAAPRGVIFDAAGAILASNQPSFELVANPLDLPKDPSALDQEIGDIAAAVQLSPDEIKADLENSTVRVYESIAVKPNLTRDQALILSERAANLPGFQVINTPIRDYLNAPVFAHALGYVGKINPQEYRDKSAQGYLFNDFLGKTGLEQVYENFLRGEFGQREVEVDARGAVKHVFGQKNAQPGDNLYLNLDAGLQNQLYNLLQERLKEIGKTRAAAIALDPQNGKVLALVNFPSFDNNLFASGITPADYQKLTDNPNHPLFDRAIQGTYPPGSTVKPMIAAAGLQEKVITPSTLIDDTGQIVVRNPYGGPDYHFYGYNRSGLGTVDVRKAIALSSDIYFYSVGGGYDTAKIGGLGMDRLAAYLKRFKLGSVLGIDLPGEQDGLVPTPQWKQQHFAGDPVAARWYLGDTYHVSIGQGDLLVTPLQLVSWIATIANGGQIYRPYLVDKITDQNGRLIKQFTPQAIGSPGIDQTWLEVVREGMRMAVTEGTARSLNSLPVSAAAKTGTAQFDAKHPDRAHAWFTAFAPFDNPQIAVVVLIEDGGEGGINAVPVARGILDWWAKNRYVQSPTPNLPGNNLTK